MKAYICDQCGKRDESQSTYELPPKGWYTLSEPDTFKHRHLCGPECLCTMAATKITEAIALEPPPSAPVEVEASARG